MSSRSTTPQQSGFQKRSFKLTSKVDLHEFDSLLDSLRSETAGLPTSKGTVCFTTPKDCRDAATYSDALTVTLNRAKEHINKLLRMSLRMRLAAQETSLLLWEIHLNKVPAVTLTTSSPPSKRVRLNGISSLTTSDPTSNITEESNPPSPPSLLSVPSTPPRTATTSGVPPAPVKAARPGPLKTGPGQPSTLSRSPRVPPSGLMDMIQESTES